MKIEGDLGSTLFSVVLKFFKFKIESSTKIFFKLYGQQNMFGFLQSI